MVNIKNSQVLITSQPSYLLWKQHQIFYKCGSAIEREVWAFKSSNIGALSGHRDIQTEAGKGRPRVLGIQRRTGLVKQRQEHIYFSMLLSIQFSSFSGEFYYYYYYYSWASDFHVKFRIRLSIYTKIICQVFDGVCFSSKD